MTWRIWILMTLIAVPIAFGSLYAWEHAVWWLIEDRVLETIQEHCKP
jgi:hypothetical protein